MCFVSIAPRKCLMYPPCKRNTHIIMSKNTRFFTEKEGNQTEKIRLHQSFPSFPHGSPFLLNEKLKYTDFT